jgi:hypothetical protein
MEERSQGVRRDFAEGLLQLDSKDLFGFLSIHRMPFGGISGLSRQLIAGWLQDMRLTCRRREGNFV